jgi:hypothetical protein
MFPNALASEQVAVVGVIDPDAYTQATYKTAAIDMSQWEEVMIIGMAGDLGSSGTLDFDVYEYTDASDGGEQEITSKSATQLTQAGTDSNKQVVINVRREDLDIRDDFRYIKAWMIVGTATSDCGLVVVGVVPRRAPASDNDLSTVDEIKT